MSLVTRCPVCATTFRVLPAQLSARGGRVRCGKCSAVFDGVTSLLTDEAVAALPEEPSPQLGLFEARQSGPEHVDSGKTAGAAPQRDDAESSRSDAPGDLGKTAEVKSRAPSAPIPRGKVSVPPFLEPERPRAVYTLVWAILAVVALSALALQAILHFRTEIGVLLPQARTHLETACDILGCEVRLPRRADLMSIESSDLQADSQRPKVIVLNALLRNRAPFPQEYPDLELTLTDQGDRPVIRRVLRPGDYLKDNRSVIALGMGGGAEEPVRVFLETDGVLATGYQLFLFYPCPAPSPSPFWQLSYPVRCQNSRNR